MKPMWPHTQRACLTTSLVVSIPLGIMVSIMRAAADHLAAAPHPRGAAGLRSFALVRARTPAMPLLCGRVVAHMRAHRGILLWGTRAILTAVVRKPIGRADTRYYTRKPRARLADSHPNIVGAA
jgi:energy-converting hydrogenase Eha subunit F